MCVLIARKMSLFFVNSLDVERLPFGTSPAAPGIYWEEGTESGEVWCAIGTAHLEMKNPLMQI